MSDSGRSEEEIDLFEGVSSRRADAPLLFGWAKGKDPSRAEAGGRKDIFNRRMSIRVGARRLADARRPCGVQRPAPLDRRPHHHNWSRPFSMDVVNTVGALRCGEHEVGISVEYAPPPALFSKVVTFAPRFIIRNGLGGGMSLAYRQTLASEAPRTLAPGAEVAFHWPSPRSEVKTLELALAASGSALFSSFAAAASAAADGDGTGENIYSRFCHGLPIDEVTDFILRLGEPPRELEVVRKSAPHALPAV